MPSSGGERDFNSKTLSYSRSNLERKSRGKRARDLQSMNLSGLSLRRMTHIKGTWMPKPRQESRRSSRNQGLRLRKPLFSLLKQSLSSSVMRFSVNHPFLSTQEKAMCWSLGSRKSSRQRRLTSLLSGLRMKCIWWDHRK